MIIVALVNIIIFIVVFAVLWKILELALKLLGIGVDGTIKQIVLLLFLLVLLLEIFGLIGLGTPHYLFYKG